MGIKDLWNILCPFCDRKPLYELQGKTVAVDLSCWICEAQNVSEYQVQPRMYLRNLYFRTCYLLLSDVTPVFVLEGKAPVLKHGTMSARNAIQFRGARPKKASQKTPKDRSHFNHTLKQCEEMLKYMGLACVRGKGEAEKMCAYLNSKGLVDGCISQDSDCFAYGASIVYRNFSISYQGPHQASGGAVDVYNIHKAFDGLGLGRNKLIALALLCGCDYSDGVHGVGKDSAMKLFEKVPDCEILNRLRSWRSQGDHYDRLERKYFNKDFCTSCGHPGKIQSHTKIGCRQCNTAKGCDTTIFKDERLFVKNELNIRSKALADADFPDEELIQEFLHNEERIQLDLCWNRPNLRSFVKFTAKYLGWEEVYSLEKFLPVSTRWQLLNYKSEVIIEPKRIKKTRTPKNVPSYEIIWLEINDILAESPEVDLEKLWSTIEPQRLVKVAYPDLVDEFEKSKIKPKRKAKTTAEKKTRKPKKTKMEDLESSFKELVVQKPKTIDSYFKKAVLNAANLGPKMADLDTSKFGDESDLDVSDIIEDIISRKPADLVGEFFPDSIVENDAFEQSFANAEDSESDEFSFDEEYVPLYERLTRK